MSRHYADTRIPQWTHQRSQEPMSANLSLRN